MASVKVSRYPSSRSGIREQGMKRHPAKMVALWELWAGASVHPKFEFKSAE
jgi:hypothetical protein